MRILVVDNTVRSMIPIYAVLDINTSKIRIAEKIAASSMGLRGAVDYDELCDAYDVNVVDADDMHNPSYYDPMYDEDLDPDNIDDIVEYFDLGPIDQTYYVSDLLY